MLSIIVAVSQNGVIGNKGVIPWKLSADMKYFAAKTRGHAIIMGRKTFETIGRPLPERINIVITRNKDFSSEEIIVTHSLVEALEKAEGDDEIFIIGGGELYKEALPFTNRVYKTEIKTTVPGDAHFPNLAEDEWELVSSETHAADEKNQFDYTFNIYERK